LRSAVWWLIGRGFRKLWRGIIQVLVAFPKVDGKLLQVLWRNLMAVILSRTTRVGAIGIRHIPVENSLVAAGATGMVRALRTSIWRRLTGSGLNWLRIWINGNTILGSNARITYRILWLLPRNGTRQCTREGRSREILGWSSLLWNRISVVTILGHIGRIAGGILWLFSNCTRHSTGQVSRRAIVRWCLINRSLYNWGSRCHGLRLRQIHWEWRNRCWHLRLIRLSLNLRHPWNLRHMKWWLLVHLKAGGGCWVWILIWILERVLVWIWILRSRQLEPHVLSYNKLTVDILIKGLALPKYLGVVSLDFCKGQKYPANHNVEDVGIVHQAKSNVVYLFVGHRG